MSPALDPHEHVRVRMYDVGFGDAFVILFPDGTGFRSMLVDCGSIKKGAAGSVSKVAKRIVDDVVVERGSKRFDVVVASHRHKDHVEGFEAAVWDEVDVGEVWLPWTEDPDDPDATRIREAQASLALALASRSRSLAPGLADLAANALSNARAMATLHGGFKSREVQTPRFLPEEDRARATFRTDRLPGVLVRVVGPSRLDEVIRDMDPPSSESYLSSLGLLPGQGAGDESGAAPFAAACRVDRRQYEATGAAALPEGLEERAGTAGVLDEGDLAASLDSSVNGTSLMLMLDVGDVRLLLPGDAQWGTWNAALTDTEWGPLFAGATFYKVGHHGSHNATPVTFVEQHLKDGIPAMTSVNPVAQWDEIPRLPLLERMTDLKHAKVARSDKPADAAGAAFKRAPDDAWIETWLKI